jgi:putative transport protein
MFSSFKTLFTPTSTPDMTQSLIVILLTIGLGVFVGRLKIGKVGLGPAAVMFIGLILGHYGYTIQEDISDFIKDFGLILFVYGIGIQVGPSFLSSFRKDGLKYNLLAASTVLLGGLVTFLIYLYAKPGIEYSVGLMSGAVTNTPGLGAAKATLQEIQAQFPDRVFHDPAVAYAITYPVGVLGIILMIILTKMGLRLDLSNELGLLQGQENDAEKLVHKKIRVTNPELFNKSIYKILKENNLNDVIVSRMKHSGSSEVFTPTMDVRVQQRDVLMVVGKPQPIKAFIKLAGKESMDLVIESEQDVISKFLYVSNKKITHKTLGELELFNKYGLKVTRVFRSGMELLANSNLELYYGDMLRVVGNREDIEEVEKIIGNSEKKLLEPDFLSLFGGLVVGIIIGVIPIAIPSLPVPIKLGFAAGPLIAALLISKYGGIGVIHSYINNGAIYFMKDLGICLFFAAVGVHAGAHFYDNFVAYNGWLWIFYGALITFLPLLIMVFIGRFVLKINYYHLVGLMSGTYTDPAALAFSNSYLESDLPTQTYATVYPLVTICRILVAQLLILLCI